MSRSKCLWWSAPLLLALGACGPQQTSAPEPTPVAAKSGDALAPNDGVPQARVGMPVPLRATDSAPPAPVVGQVPAVQSTTVAVPPVAMPSPSPSPASPAAVRTAAVRPAKVALMGEVRAIEPIRERPPGTGKGAVIGGVLGGVVGNQFGHGNGRAAMTVLGAAGGAVAGNNVERNMNKRIVGYRVSVRLDNGQARTYTEPRLDGLRVGDRVRVDGKHVRRA
jgi:outer membrane lipoprotein SlyB